MSLGHVGCGIFLLALAIGELPAWGQAAKEAPDLMALCRERRGLLEDALRIVTAHYRGGLVGFERVASTELELRRAALDCCTTKEQRIAALEVSQKSAESLVQLAEARQKSGQGDEVDVLKAKARVLEIRIALLREKQAAKPGK